MQKRCVIAISGQVQGVGFRYHAQDKAREFGLAGFVRNEEDGTVRIEAQGEEASVRALIEWCKSGSLFTRVDDVKCEWGDLADGYSDFVIEK